MACDPAKLQEAKDAYHALLTGKTARVVVDQNGERVEFVAANAASLLSYIQTLEAECLRVVLGNRPRPGPFGFIF